MASISEIFDSMNYPNERNEDMDLVLKESNTHLHPSIQSALEKAEPAQILWKEKSYKNRSDVLYKIWKELSKRLNLLSKFKELPPNGIANFINYFDFYSDVLITNYMSVDDDQEPVGNVFIQISHYSSFFILGPTVSAALAAGCSVTVNTPYENSQFPLTLADIFIVAGLPEGLFNVVSSSVASDTGYMLNEINKLIVAGDFHIAKAFQSANFLRSVSCLCYNSTSAIVLESCDVNAAVDKIFFETWNKNHVNIWGVSTVVVQESIYGAFTKRLKFRKQLTEQDPDFCCTTLETTTLNEIEKIIEKAITSGARVEHSESSENKCGITIIFHYQNQDIEPHIPVLKVLTCRTTKEGIALINNCRYNVGTSVWTEIGAEALEVASKLVCQNVWINCHGVVEPSIPFEPSGCSGKGVFGGLEGIGEYLCCGSNDLIKTDEFLLNMGEEIPNKVIAEQYQKLVHMSQNAFHKWRLEKHRKKLLLRVAESFETDDKKLCEAVSCYVHLGSMISFSESTSIKELFALQKKEPIGVIALYIMNSCEADDISIASLIAAALTFGNALILVAKSPNNQIKYLFERFKGLLPHNLLMLIEGSTEEIILASDPAVQAIWLYKNDYSRVKFYKTSTMKRIWVIPQTVPFSQRLFQKECLRNRVIWMTKTDQFP